MTSPQENMCVLTTFTTFYVLNSRFQAPASAPTTGLVALEQ